jgi:hypothetical protein
MLISVQGIKLLYRRNLWGFELMIMRRMLRYEQFIIFRMSGERGMSDELEAVSGRPGGALACRSSCRLSLDELLVVGRLELSIMSLAFVH